MKILFNKSELNEALDGVTKLGFVPTMGSLHSGHASLIRNSLKECKQTIVSIFVNPRQFNSKRDFTRYPRNKQKDLNFLKRLKVNFVFLPKKGEIFDSKKTKFRLKNKDNVLCAKYRKGHFEGVIDVMSRLTKIIQPSKIFMGEKDFQQIYLLKKYLKIKSNCEIISCKTIRERNKLALSSRNSLLKKKDFIKAGNIARDIFFFKKKITKKKHLNDLFLNKKKELEKIYKIKIEYFELRKKLNLKHTKNFNNAKIFIAYYLNNIRLIDNF